MKSSFPSCSFVVCFLLVLQRNRATVDASFGTHRALLNSNHIHHAGRQMVGRTCHLSSHGSLVMVHGSYAVRRTSSRSSALGLQDDKIDNPRQNDEHIPSSVQSRQQSEPEVLNIQLQSDHKKIELALLGMWMGLLSAFILVNNFVGPWPAGIVDVHERVWFTFHMLGGMFFGGGIILTTAIEWLVAKDSDSQVLNFWFHKVPLLDMAIVLPGLTMAMISGTGLAVEHYGSLGAAPKHIQMVFYTLVTFAIWWATTDLTTQGHALAAVNEYHENAKDENAKGSLLQVPEVVKHRTISNVVSCLFVFALYVVMVIKPGTLHY